jgi:hypothetical protein
LAVLRSDNNVATNAIDPARANVVATASSCGELSVPMLNASGALATSPTKARIKMNSPITPANTATAEARMAGNN